MVVISYKMIREFGKKHRDSLEALDSWYHIFKKVTGLIFMKLREFLIPWMPSGMIYMFLIFAAITLG
jgi:hypothetical protein